jgi:hypothetical protein
VRRLGLKKCLAGSGIRLGTDVPRNRQSLGSHHGCRAIFAIGPSGDRRREQACRDGTDPSAVVPRGTALATRTSGAERLA